MVLCAVRFVVFMGCGVSGGGIKKLWFMGGELLKG